MARIIGITGGIGSGKTTVCNIFREQGYPVYDCDNEAKRLMQDDSGIRQQILDLFGTLDRAEIARKVFDDKGLLQQLNNIVHPAVACDLQQWAERQEKSIVFAESAILFESGLDKLCWKTVVVTAPEEVRIERVMRRNGWTREQVVNRMRNQMPEEKLKQLADIIIKNSEFGI